MNSPNNFNWESFYIYEVKKANVHHLTISGEDKFCSNPSFRVENVLLCLLHFIRIINIGISCMAMFEMICKYIVCAKILGRSS